MVPPAQVQTIPTELMFQHMAVSPQGTVLIQNIRADPALLPHVEIGSTKGEGACIRLLGAEKAGEAETWQGTVCAGVLTSTAAP